MAFGHAFAYESEHDQAVAAYQAAARHMPGCHLPLLFIGQEYVQMDNALADAFLQHALDIAPEDPDVLHEMGVLKYQSGEYLKAEQYLKQTVEKVGKGQWMVSQLHWEALLNNYGHVCRKLGKYDEAQQSHVAALRLNPSNPSTHSFLGLVYSLAGQSMKAVEEYHKALEITKEDTLTMQLLNKELELLADVDPLQGIGMTMPADTEETSQDSVENMDALAQSESLSDIEID
jgi:anaphase-promoting complex subunit 6